ncbi:MAG: TetR/AcrR family transcriptional regulator [Gammaproteobacteria bacterium]|nr:TetR/AcrR family transcriptional regulator [Gammaproteobacteria bacterium]
MATRASPRLRPKSWIKAALTTLQNEGIEQVRVERLAKNLGVTKGSFYWHFKDRQHLLDGLLDYWFHTMTETVFFVARRFQGEPRERMHAVVEDITRRERTGYDLAVRAWARNDAKAAAAVRDIDNQRLAFLRKLFEDMGFDHHEADQRARLLYGYILGDATSFNKPSRQQRVDLIHRHVELLADPTR